MFKFQIGDQKFQFKENLDGLLQMALYGLKQAGKQ